MSPEDHQSRVRPSRAERLRAASPSRTEAEDTAVEAVRPSRTERLHARSRPAVEWRSQPGQRGAARPRRGARERRAWPGRLALLALVAVAMVVCWLWVFPWLETVLPAEF